MRRVPLILIVCALAVVMLPHCGEKCPLEPCGPSEGRICGSVEWSAEFPLTFRDLRVMTLAGSVPLGCDRSFEVPVLEGSGVHLVALTTQDTVPVLLGYCLPEPGSKKDDGKVTAGSAYTLSAVIGSPKSGINLSAASTALTLAMTNPLVAGATEEERFWLASEMVAHEDFEDVVAAVAEGLRASPGTYLCDESVPDPYPAVGRLVSDAIDDLSCGAEPDTSGLGPYVENAPGNRIALRNAGFIHYGVGIVDAVVDTPRTVLLLPRRRVSMFVEPHPPSRQEYDLGEACAEIAFFKGIVGVEEPLLVETGNPGGLASHSNVGQAVWNVLAIFETLPAYAGPGGMIIGGEWALEALGEVIRSGGPADVMLLALECASRSPDAAVEVLLDGQVGASGLKAFISTMRPVLERNAAWMAAGGLDDWDRFATDLIASPEYVSTCVCKSCGELFDCPDAPVLSLGGVEPDSGDLFTEFTYLVHYYDALGDPPEFVRVVIDADEYDMELLNGEPSDGVYRYSAQLPPGLHLHYFICADTTGAGARLPPGGSVEGAFVVTPPVLSNGYVEPALGSTTTSFRYNVDCYDADGQLPAAVTVFIDGDPFTMERSYSWEDNHRYKFVKRLLGGTHDYYFTVEDPCGHVARLPAEGVIEGPQVSQYLPELSNPSVNPPLGIQGDRFTYTVDYFDQDGDAPWFVNAYLSNGTTLTLKLRSGIQSDGTYSYSCVLKEVGEYTYYFMCADSTGIPVRLPETGTLSGPYVERRPGGRRNWDAKIAVHVMAYDEHMDCADRMPEIQGCWDIYTTYEGWNFLAFPVFFDLVEYQGVEFGLTWPEWSGSAAWHTCADLAIGDISRPGDGLSAVWYLCRFDNVAIPGWAWMYAEGPGLVAPCPHPFTDEIQVLNCAEMIDRPWAWFHAGVNGATGESPCWPPPEGPGDRGAAGTTGR